MVSDGFFHPPLPGRLVLKRVLKSLEGYTFERVRSLERLPEDMDRYAALVLHYHHKILSAEALARLDGYVKKGGGMLAIHAATASFEDSPAYFDILGGRFTGHGKVEAFHARRRDETVFSGIGDFSVVDELYIHELKPGIQVHYTADLNGEDIPVVWTYRYGEGKVCYAVPGHTTGSMRNPTYQAVLKRGLEWAAA